MAEKIYLICEKSDVKLERIQQEAETNNDYVFEGVFAEFGIRNNNDRIYQENVYLPHLDYLNQKIKNRTLVGELDHPEKFDISLSKVSHIIEHLEYNKQKRQVIGRIRLLDTRAGKDAKALVDSGVQLSISSRAAGVVKENKEVDIKRIFTYDIVNDPGFPNAQINRVNEQFGFAEDSNIQIYEFISEEIIKQNEKALSEDPMDNVSKTTEDSSVNDKIEETKTMVTKEELTSYTQYMSDKFKVLEDTIKSKDEIINNLRQVVEQNQANNVAYMNKLCEELQNNVDYTIELSEHVDNNISFSNLIAESCNNTIDYQGLIQEKVNELITENENIIDYTELGMKHIDTNIQFVEHVAENLQLMEKYQEKVGETINWIGEYQEYLKENIDNSISFSEYIAEAVKSIDNNSVNENNKLNESIENNVEQNKKSTQSILEGIDNVIETIKKDESARLTEQAQNKYFNLLQPQTQREFILLPNNQKQQIMEAVNKYKPVSEDEFKSIWTKVLNPQSPDEIVEKLVSEIPEEYKEIWDKLDEQNKKHLIAQSQFYNLKTDSQIKEFWNTRPLLNERKELEYINRNDIQDKIQESNKQMDTQSILGYGAEHIERVRRALKK